MTKERHNYLFNLFCLSSIPKIGPRRIRLLIERFKSPEQALQASPRELIQVDGIEQKLAHSLKTKVDQKFAENQLQQMREKEIRVVSFWDNEYPDLLKAIFDPPTYLFYRGNISILKEKSVAVVGTRHPSRYGSTMAEKLTRELLENDLVVLSGLARGIDTIAHQTCIKFGGKTIAVLGSGLDRIYPPENNNLALEIQKNGLLISEFAIGSGPDAPHFPRRNRVVSGLSEGVLVIEAGKKSGALITAGLGLDQGREIFAVPGNVTSPQSTGTNRLIQEGAKLVASIDDILPEIKMPKSSPKAKMLQLDPLETVVYGVLSGEPLHIDQLALKVGRESYDLLPILLQLELKAIIKQLPGKFFIKAI